MDDDIKTLLESWKCSEALPILTENFVTVERLKFLSPDDIRDLFPVVGLRAEFREKLDVWKKRNFKEDEAPVQINAPDTLGSFLDVLHFLSENSTGKGILEYYQKNSDLLESHRKDVIDIIVHKVLQYGIALHSKEFEIINEQIIKIFPTESKDYYYSANKGEKRKSGKFYYKYNNVSCKRRKVSKAVAPAPQENDDLSEDLEFVADDLNLLRKSMINNISASINKKKVGSAWKRTLPLRKADFKASANTSEFLKKWPEFKEALGYLLIRFDFETQYPKSKSALFHKWDEFVEKIVPYYQDNLKGVASRESFAACKRISNINSKDFFLARLLNSVIKPSARFQNNEGKATKKYSIADGEENFSMHLICINNLSTKVEELKNKCFKSAETLQPLIIAVGADVFELTDFYVYFDKVLYKRSNFLRALDTCFQIFQVFNLKYPPACQNVWTFIQQHFYGISTKFDEVSSCSISLMHYLQSQS